MDCRLIIIEYELRPPSLSELTPIIFNMELTHLGSEASKTILQHSLQNFIF